MWKLIRESILIDPSWKTSTLFAKRQKKWKKSGYKVETKKLWWEVDSTFEMKGGESWEREEQCFLPDLDWYPIYRYQLYLSDQRNSFRKETKINWWEREENQREREKKIRDKERRRLMSERKDDTLRVPDRIIKWKTNVREESVVWDGLGRERKLECERRKERRWEKEFFCPRKKETEEAKRKVTQGLQDRRKLDPSF